MRFAAYPLPVQGGRLTQAAILMALTGSVALLSVALAWSPFLTLGVVIGALLTVFALMQPLALVGLMLLIGPADLSVVTGGFKSMFENLGGLDMNGIRLIGMSFALTLVIISERGVFRQIFRPAAIPSGRPRSPSRGARTCTLFSAASSRRDGRRTSSIPSSRSRRRRICAPRPKWPIISRTTCCRSFAWPYCTGA